MYLFLDAVIVVGLSQLTYQVTEAPNAVATVCATIEVALGSVSKDTIVNLVTPLTGSMVTGELHDCFERVCLLDSLQHSS